MVLTSEQLAALATLAAVMIFLAGVLAIDYFRRLLERKAKRAEELAHELKFAAQAPYKVEPPAQQPTTPPVINNNLQRVFDVSRVVVGSNGTITQLDITLASTGETQFLVPKE